MTSQARISVGNWGRRATRALDLVRRGYVVELLAEDEIVGHMVPVRLPITDAIIERAVRGRSDESVAELRQMLKGLAATGEWSWEPHADRYVAIPPLPTFPSAEGAELDRTSGESGGWVLARLWERAVAAVGDEARARRWLVSSRSGLGGRTPVEAALAGDLDRVLQILSAIQHGTIL